MKKKLGIYRVDELTKICGHFFCGDSNNGYSCSHPEQEEQDEEEGCCFGWSCPLGFSADKEDFKDKQINKRHWEEYEECGFVVCEIDRIEKLKTD
ncbi:MAG: hypothetical protein EOM59_11735 [Clostridia bacterium]|nr:hypothetical protein [Clostridia bacterium]